ncbi:ubiquitin carboxyl-terminal hydrolase 16 [Macrosteles quadrilineatus]|uniref:ubiquitin carboxyl-terminal hydrolase 16 n=1 Tax=Macrosteles quadrilineatus TaxID=74068 RepID=UPI0023E14378|nr:ubiquitin carboxyl-terminal hydrolase 16 [Macrosteles quadrilineatus]
MGKKKRSHQNSSNIVGDSSESESSKDSTQPGEATNKACCPHINKSVEIANIRKNLKTSRDKNTHNLCSLCKKNESSLCKDGWVCLRCGSCNCGPEEEDHRTDHYKTPRSDAHYLAYQVNNNLIWCFMCERDIPIDVSKKVQSCADFIKKQYSDNLPFSPVRVESDSKKMNGTEGLDFLKDDITPRMAALNKSINKDEVKPVLSLPKVRGLSNLGNTCFFNSVLQCLAQTPGLVDLLKEMDVPGEKFPVDVKGVTIDAVLKRPKGPLVSAPLADILTEVAGVPGGGDCHTVNPRKLLDALTSKCPQFEGGDQHDAHELLRHLLDSVHNEDLRRYQKAILDHIGYNNNNLDELEEDKKKFAKSVNQLVCDTIPIRPDQVFKGSLVSILQCTVCYNKSEREEPFLDLSLPVAQEKAQPPTVRKKQNCNSPVEEEHGSLERKDTKSKHQLKKEAKVARKNAKRQGKKDKNGEFTIEEEDKKDSKDGEQSDADVEDNEDNACEEQDQKTEIVESGYSSEKQMSARGSPVTTQSPEDEKTTTSPVLQNQASNVIPGVYSSEDPETLLAKRAESGLGSIQELTVAIPEEINTECNSQDSVRVNASNGSPDISSDSQQSSFRNVDLSLSSSSDYKLPPSSDSQVDRNTMIYDWNCSGDVKLLSQDSSSLSVSLSPLCGSGSHSQKNSPGSNDNMSMCASLQHSNEMSVCNSLPENVSMILNSPVKSREDNSGSDERPESRMECRNRSSPVEPREITELDSGLLKLSLEGMTCADMDTDGAEDVKVDTADSPTHVGSFKGAIPLPPPQPPTQLFSAPYTFVHPSPSVPSLPAIPRYSPSTSTSYFPRQRIEEGECSLHSCLTQFTCIEVLAGANKTHCEACTERLNKGNKEGKPVYQNSTKQLLISKLPPVIIFHLKRFQVQRCSFKKISRHVDFPLVLDVAQFCSINENEPILYSLYGVVEHSGTLHGGHYVAYVKVRSHADRRPGQPPPGRWYYISDSRVSDVDENTVLKTQAYLLFYERIF